jgi:hypothetical protein
VHCAVDPHHPSNAGIADLQRAPRDAHGLVHYSADVRILQPVALQRGNQRLLLDIVNRGNPTVLTNFNSAVGRLEPGNGFLMRQRPPGLSASMCRRPSTLTVSPSQGRSR